MALLFLNPWPFAICSSTRVNVESYASHNNLNDLITWDNYMINLKRLVMCKFKNLTSYQCEVVCEKGGFLYFALSSLHNLLELLAIVAYLIKELRR